MSAQIESLRLPPHSVEAEQAVLGGLLMANAAWDRIGDVLIEADFYRVEHRVLWRAITKLIEDNKPADVLTVAEALKATGELPAVHGGMAYLNQIATGTPSTANIRRYADIVRDRSIKRQLAEVGVRISDQAYSGHGDAGQLLEESERGIFAIGEKRARGQHGFRSIGELLPEVMSRLDELHRNPASVTGRATGFIDLDEKTAGLQDGDLIVVAGRPSMGKTALALNIAEHAAVQLKVPALVFSMEMGGTQLAQRLLGSVGRVDSHHLRTGRLAQHEWDRMGAALGTLHQVPLHIDETAALTPTEIRARARRKAREYGGVGLIIVDYLQLMSAGRGSKSDNRAGEIGEITSALKALAKELSCPVIALSQLNRSLESRANRRPVMSDLKDSGSVEQDADVILFIYRDEVYHEDTPDKGIAEIIIGKQRNGPVGTVRLTYLAQHTRFENWAPSPGYTPTPRKPPKRAFTEQD